MIPFSNTLLFPTSGNGFRKHWLRMAKTYNDKEDEQKVPTRDVETGISFRANSMSSLLMIKPFKGLAVGSEDPGEYLEDMQAAAEGWHMSGPAETATQAAFQKAMMRFI